MKKKEIFVTNGARQTRKLGELLAKELRGGEILCLSGELGSGKTTFAQGILRGLKIKGPYTSPTFVVMKKYHITHNTKHISRQKKVLRVTSYELRDAYHIDAYRVGPKDIIELGWKEIIAGKSNIVIVEWAERIKNIIPEDAIWIKFEHIGKNKRKIVIGNKAVGSWSGCGS
ncbi:MAG: hypothetical protein A2359_00060 [Candidatus Moranbacteria bacterium RIFOXYB1_FULL_43_19]|nr:MAG: hypothetical protein A2184_04100 [Candidatus Moranbacteria bacterium RIFOXYA1_FULL_44_7]OGI26856.1 MAG: hypothetical protein A2359_00060 [Candidatus Moranbacteria bacterium RIFOXYB1_FULL_43_19]OGI34114.1 MAG: hypothetical protein A2420_04780 [Candidatus Moranbacteria bacterium RIFOXYC1_FULL_44_13]OGI37597.1 MAG: hypothetical protein A2612_04530 [Candidatus Moranbacteria bacterium RIFOXYD1_FULL_44_12]